jgi:hypothetical protein
MDECRTRGNQLGPTLTRQSLLSRMLPLRCLITPYLFRLSPPMEG